MADLTLEQQRAIAIAGARARANQVMPSTTEARQAAVQARAKEMEARDTAIQQQEELANIETKRNDRMLRWQLAPDPGTRMRLLLTEFIPTIKDSLVEAGIVGGSAAVGQAIGQRAGKPGRMAGGALGAAAGSTADQIIKVSTGEQAEIKPGKIVSDAVAGAVSTPGMRANVTGNVAAETVRSLIDEKELPSLRNVNEAAATGAIAAAVSKKLTGRTLAPDDALFQYRNDAFRALRGEGIRVNPQLLSRGGKVVPVLAGESTLNTATSRLNQPIYQKLVREELGLSKKPLPIRPRQNPDPATGKTLVKGEIDEVIDKASKPYEKIRQISEDIQKQIDDFKAGKAKTHPLVNRTPQEAELLLSTNQNLDALKQARDAANKARARMKANDPTAYEDFKAAKALEDEIEAKLVQAADIAGNPNLVNELKESRIKLAKAFAVREATDSFGIVDINELARMRETASKPGRMLTGRLKELADFAEAFGPSAQDAVAVAVERPANVAMNYSARQAAMGHASGFLSAGVPVLSQYAKELLLDNRMQNRFSRPKYVLNPETVAPTAARQFIMGLGRDEDIQVPFAAP